MNYNTLLGEYISTNSLDKYKKQVTRPSLDCSYTNYIKSLQATSGIRVVFNSGRRVSKSMALGLAYGIDSGRFESSNYRVAVL